MRNLATAFAAIVLAGGVSAKASALTLDAGWYYDLVVVQTFPGGSAPDGEGFMDSIATNDGDEYGTFTLTEDALLTVTDIFEAGRPTDNFRVLNTFGGTTEIGRTNGGADLSGDAFSSEFGVDPRTERQPGGGTIFAQPGFQPDVYPFGVFDTNPPPGVDEDDAPESVEDAQLSSASFRLTPGTYTLAISSDLFSGNPIGAGFYVRLDSLGSGVIPVPGALGLLLTALGMAHLVGRRRR